MDSFLFIEFCAGILEGCACMMARRGRGLRIEHACAVPFRITVDAAFIWMCCAGL
jgi:hypothetical protein